MSSLLRLHFEVRLQNADSRCSVREHNADLFVYHLTGIHLQHAVIFNNINLQHAVIYNIELVTSIFGTVSRPERVYFLSCINL